VSPERLSVSSGRYQVWCFRIRGFVGECHSSNLIQSLGPPERKSKDYESNERRITARNFSGRNSIGPFHDRDGWPSLPCFPSRSGTLGAPSLRFLQEPALRVCDFIDVAKNRCCKQHSYDGKMAAKSTKSHTLSAAEGAGSDAAETTRFLPTNPVGHSFVVPALRKPREGRGTTVLVVPAKSKPGPPAKDGTLGSGMGK
jgi:hypothetical protein